MQYLRARITISQYSPRDPGSIPRKPVCLAARMQESSIFRRDETHIDTKRIGVSPQRIDQSTKVCPDAGMRHGQKIAIYGDSERRGRRWSVVSLHIEA